MIIGEVWIDIAHIGSGAYVAHGVNCKGVMGSGVAKDLSDENKGLLDKHKYVCSEGLLQPGKVFLFSRGQNGPIIVNMATQDGYSSNPERGPMARVEWIEECVSKMEEKLPVGQNPIYIPKIGCGLGGLDWDSQVAPIFRQSTLKFILCKKNSVIVAGSRSITEYDVVDRAITLSIPMIDPITKIISGAARGVDKLGEQWAKRNNFPIKRFPADWDSNPGKTGGIIRNGQMARYSDTLIAIWDGKSSGTVNMIEQASARNLRVVIHDISQNS